MAEVFKVWHTGLHRFEALKSLLPGLSSDALFVQRFLHEARIAAALSHPHIAAIYNVGPDSAPRPFFTMEFIEGGDLADLLERNGKMSLQQAISLLIPIADALDYAHARGVVHRDVKPGNVLLHTTSRSDWSAKVVDFGIARAQEDQGGTRLTKAGLIVGTPEYMSPEQAGNGQPVDHRTDLYSLGVIAYEMVCGQPPFWVQGNLSSLSVIASHLRDDPPPPRGIEPALPDSVNDAILKALAKNPDDRFATCASFMDALTSDVSATLLNAAPTASAAPLENGSANPAFANWNGRGDNSAYHEGAADRDTAVINTNAPVPGQDGTMRAAPSPSVHGSAAGSKAGKKWLWPALAAAIGAVVIAVQMFGGAPSSSEADPFLTPTPITSGTNTPGTVVSNTTPATPDATAQAGGVAPRNVAQPTPKAAPTAQAPKAVDRVRTEVSTQPIKFSIVRRATAALLLGQQRVSQTGQNGVRQVRTQVTLRDGRAMARRVLQTKVLKNSVPQIVLIGTRKAAPSTASSRSSRAVRRVPLRRSTTSSNRYRRSTEPRRYTGGSTRRRSPRRRGRESSLPIVESPLP